MINPSVSADFLMSAHGTKRKSRDVRFRAAVRGIADIKRALIRGYTSLSKTEQRTPREPKPRSSANAPRARGRGKIDGRRPARGNGSGVSTDVRPSCVREEACWRPVLYAEQCVPLSADAINRREATQNPAPLAPLQSV
jgi:hypothetical protein